MGHPPFPNSDSELVRRVRVSDPGGETTGLPLPLDSHPYDRRPLECVERITLEGHYAPARRQNDDHRLALHTPTVAARGVTSVTILLRAGVNLRALGSGAISDPLIGRRDPG